VAGLSSSLPYHLSYRLHSFPGAGLIDLGDVLHLINYLYKSGPAPVPLIAGDCNCDGVVDLGDVLYLINYLYRGGDPPSC